MTIDIALTIAQITVGAILVERLIEFFVKPRLPQRFQSWTVYLAIILGEVIVLSYGLDMMAAVGFGHGEATLVGKILTGVIIGGGSAFVHDLFASMQAKKDSLRTESAVQVAKVEDKA